MALNLGTCKTDIFPKWGFLNWIFGHFFNAWNLKSTRFRYFEQNIGTFCDFWLKWGLVELKNVEKEVFWSRWGSVKKGSLPPDIRVALFKVSMLNTPPGSTLRRDWKIKEMLEMRHLTSHSLHFHVFSQWCWGIWYSWIYVDHSSLAYILWKRKVQKKVHW